MEKCPQCWDGLRIALFSAFCLLFTSSITLAQTSQPMVLFGVEGGINFVAYQSAYFTPPTADPNEFSTLGSGSGLDQFVGISSEISLSSANQNFMLFEAIFDSKSGNFGTANSGNATSVFDAKLSASLTYLVFDLGFKHNFISGPIPSGLGVQLCASFGMLLTSKFNESMTTLTTTNSGVAQSGTKASIVPINGIRSYRIALRPELCDDIPFASKWILTPSVGYDAPLTQVDNTNRNWTARSVYAALALRYVIGSF